MRYNKITENLSWNSLKETYFIGTMEIAGKQEKINRLQDAINDGSLMKAIEECAESNFGGDVYAVLTTLSKNLSSTLCNMNKRQYSPNKPIDKIRYETLRKFVSDKMEEIKGSGRSGNGKAYWQWSMAEIDEIPLSELRLIKSIYDNMASKKSKYPELVATIANFDDAFQAISKKYSAAKAASKQPVAEPAIDSAIIDKLSKGTKVTLSASEAEVLRQALKILGK